MTPAPLTAIAAIEKAMEGDQHRPLVEMISWAMASRGVVDPQAIDMNGRPRWTWYVDEVERFVETNRYELRLLIACSPDRMREVLAAARRAEALERENERLREALRPFARIAEMEKRAAPATSVMVNVDRCRDAKTAFDAITLLKDSADANG